MHSLNEKTLHVSSEIERVHLGETRLLKQRRTGEYLALEKGDVDILKLFDGTQSVHEVFHTVLVAGERPKIREFYDLVYDAYEKGFLYEGDWEPEEPSRRGLDWAIHSNPFTALMIPLLLIIGGSSAVWLSDIGMIPDPSEWFLVALYVSITLSLSNLLAAAALRGYDRQIYSPDIRMTLILPYFSVDRRDAFMAGRGCEQLVALNMLAAPFFTALLGCTIGSVPMYLASLLSMLVVSAPFGRSPSHQFLHALCRRDHVVPRNADSFMKNNLFTQLFNWKKELKEEQYFIAHSTYTILWLGFVFRFSSELLQDQTELIFSDPKGIVPLIMIGFIVIFPVIYAAWLASKNMWRVAAPRLSAAEAKIHAGAKDSLKPDEATLVEFLESNVLFAELPREEIKKLAEAMSFILVKRGTTVIREHDQGDLFFVIYKGDVEVLREDEAGVSHPVAKLGTGDVFGEIALLEKRTRTSSVRTLSNCSLLALNRDDFEKIILDTLGAKQIKQLVQVCAFLRRSALFSDWPPRALVKIANEFEFTDCPQGETIITEDEQNEFFYLIYEGEFDVSKDGKSVAQLGPGEFCGEISLLRGTAANATVTAASNSRALKLDKESFLDLVSQDFVMALALDREADRRDVETEGLR